MPPKRAGRGPTVEGRRAVLEALRAGAEIDRILIMETAERGPQIDEILTLAEAAGVEVDFATRRELDRQASTRRHQGVVALVPDPRYARLEELIASATSAATPALVVVLDGIEDPHNFGAIARTADGAGAHGVVIPERRAAGVTAGSMRASAGALEHVSVARVVNLTRAVDSLKSAGLWVVGLDESGDRGPTEVVLTGPTALIIGSENAGISRLVREQCDFLVRLPMLGRIESLNASVAAAILLYEVVRQRAAPPPA